MGDEVKSNLGYFKKKTGFYSPSGWWIEFSLVLGGGRKSKKSQAKRKCFKIIILKDIGLILKTIFQDFFKRIILKRI